MMDNYYINNCYKISNSKNNYLIEYEHNDTTIKKPINIKLYNKQKDSSLIDKINYLIEETNNHINKSAHFNNIILNTKLSNSFTKRKLDRNEFLYNLNIKRKKKLQEKIKNKNKEFIKTQMKECSFSPNILSSSKKSKKSLNTHNIYTRSLLWNMSKTNKIYKIKKETELKANKDLTFKPKLISKPVNSTLYKNSFINLKKTPKKYSEIHNYKYEHSFINKINF